MGRYNRPFAYYQKIQYFCAFTVNRFRIIAHLFTLRRIVHLFLASLLLFAATGCSRKKASFTSRLYHTTTTHYNWYFNAMELIKETDNNLWANKQDDFLAILPIYVTPSPEEQKNLYPQMDAVIEKASTAIDRHSLDVKKEGDKKKKEHNKWIDDNFVLLGIANFYKGKYATAQEMFSYTTKKYKTESRFDAAVWLGRTYIEMGQYNKAFTVLSAVEKESSAEKPKDFDANLETAFADLLMRQKRYKEALPHLENAKTLTREKRMKARIAFIYGQVNKELNKSQEAVDAFKEVVKMKPDYEMEFYALINQALSFDRRMDSQKIEGMLLAMAKDDKYTNYADQIYYALGELEFEVQQIEEAVAYYKTSTRVSIDNNRQKGMSFLRLAKINFDDRNYTAAKNYYDSTSTYLPEDFPNYAGIKATGESLVGLVNDIDIITYNDSIIALADMDEDKRKKKIMRMIADLEAEEARKEAEKRDALERSNFAASAPVKGSGSSSKSWYFYNTSAISQGFTEFRRVWGSSRKLEDNWRRSNRTSFIDPDVDDVDNPDSAATVLGQKPKSSVKSLEEYLASLPLTDASLAEAHRAIVDALYDLGTIYKENLKDDNNAIESFIRITTDYDTTTVALSAYYQLYRIYFEKELAGGFVGTGLRDNSEYWKSIILSDYPNSEFAKLILDPEYVSSKSQRYADEKTVYEETYKKYSRRQYSDALIACNTVIRDEPNNNFLAKYYLVKALANGARKDADAYEATLRELIAKFPDTEEGEKAAELLGELNAVRAKIARELNAPSSPAVETPKPEPSPIASSEFKLENESEHFFSLVFPKTDGDATNIKETIAQFNSEFFKDAKLRITNSFIDKDKQIVIVRSFINKDLAIEYYTTFLANQTVLKDLNAKPYSKFVITTKNFTVLFRNKDTDGYLGFFQSAYL